MSERTIEPTLTLPDEAHADQIRALGEFTSFVDKSPETMLGALAIYHTPEASRAKKLKPAVQVIGLLLVSNADIEAKPDSPTAEAMRKELDALKRKTDGDPSIEQRRVARITAFVTERSVWLEAHPPKVPEQKRTRPVKPQEAPLPLPAENHGKTRRTSKRKVA